MKKILSIVLGVMILLTACVSKESGKLGENKNKKLKVVTTIFPEYDLTRAVARDKVDIDMLIKAGVDVHSFSPTPQDIKKIQEADIFIYGGTVHDKWVETLMKSVDFSNKRVIKLIDSVQQLEEETVEGMKHEHPHKNHEECELCAEGKKEHCDECEEHSKKEDCKDCKEKKEECDSCHEDHKETFADIEIDAHFWTTPSNAIEIVKSIANVFIEIDNTNSSFYKENAKKYIEELEKLNTELKEVRKNAKRDKVVIADRFPFRYLFDDLKIEYRAFFSGCSVESQASSSQVKQMIDYVKENKIPVVYRIEMGNGELAKTVAKDSGAKVLMLHSIHTVTPEEFDKGITYIDLMKLNIDALKEGLN